MLRVDFDELEPSEDYLVMLYEGLPFDGVAFELLSNGALEETSFLHGEKSGVAREWAATGALVREDAFLGGVFHGVSREWYDNGQTKKEGEYELGVRLMEQEWDEEGNLIRDYAIDPNGPQYETLQIMRAAKTRFDDYSKASDQHRSG